jgi:hypothetical protein
MHSASIQTQLVSKLRRVHTEKIVLVELAQAQRQLEMVLANPGLNDAARKFFVTSCPAAGFAKNREERGVGIRYL